MIDPLAEVVAMLRPGAPFSKLVAATAPWAVRRTALGRPFYLAALEGSFHLTVDGPGRSDTMAVHEGDFVLIPAARSFATSSLDRQPPLADEPVTTPIAPMPGGARVGEPGGDVDVRLLVGHCEFGSADAALLVSLLPQWLHVRGERRLTTLVQWVGDESRGDRPAREPVLARLLEVLLIEAFRSAASTAASPGLVRGLADRRLERALRAMHGRPSKTWTVAQLAREAAMSRSTFFEHFSRAVGIAPMEYLLAWRMALAGRLLRQGELTMADIAAQAGYSSVSAFGVAFTRHVGVPPGRYAKAAIGAMAS